jgi:hypothetical protein
MRLGKERFASKVNIRLRLWVCRASHLFRNQQALPWGSAASGLYTGLGGVGGGAKCNADCTSWPWLTVRFGKTRLLH